MNWSSVKWWVTKRPGLIWSLCTSRNSVGVEYVSTSPVVMCTLRIHSVSREHTDLVAGRQDVGEHQHVLVAHTCRDHIRRRVGERDAHVLGLCAVDRVAEDPASAAEALAVAGVAAVAARSARGDARHEDAIARLAILDTSTDTFDRADRFVTEHTARRDSGDVAFQDVQIGATDRHRIDAHDRIGGGGDLGLWHLFPRSVPGAVVHECVHGRHLVAVRRKASIAGRPPR